MKIVVDATVCQQPFSGIAKYLMCLYRECLALVTGDQFLFFGTRPFQHAPPGSIAAYGPTLGLLPNRGRVNEIFRRVWLRNLYHVRDADFVHFPLNGHVVTPLGRAKVAVTLHDVLPLEIPGFLATERDVAAFRARTQHDLEMADVVFTASEHSRNMILREFRPRSEPVVTPYASTLAPQDVGRGGVEVPGTPRSFYLYVGGYHPRKGIEQLVAVHTDLFTHGRISSPLVLAGKVNLYSGQLRRSIETGTNCGSLCQLGYVSDTQLIWLLRKALCLVYPSLYEGFGLPVLEAMQVGCPVVATAGTSLPEVCGNAALIVDPSDPKDFGDALIRIEVNEVLRKELAEKGLKQAARFSWRRTAMSFLSELRNEQAR